MKKSNKNASSPTPAFKFKFVVTFEYLDIRQKKDWRPRNLQVIWRRGQRQRNFDVDKEVLKYDSINVDNIESEIASAKWEKPFTSSLLVTLYKKDEDLTTFKRKEYIFSLEDNRGLTKRKLAVFPLNIAEYASLESCRHPLEMEFRTLSNKTTSVTAGLQIGCQYVKEGLSTDDDMISNFSHVSDDDEEYRKHTLSLDEDISGTVINCPTHKAVRNLAVIQSRAVQTKSDALLDLNLAEKVNITSFKFPDSPLLTSEDSKEDTSAFYDSNNDVTLSASKSDKEVKERKRLSAVGDYRVGAEESNKENVIDRKASKGNIFTSLKSGVKAVFQGRKGSLSNDLECTEDGFDAVKCATLPILNTSPTNCSTFSSSRLDESSRPSERIIELERRNQELCIRCGNLEKENVFLKRDADELQTEVCELQLLVEDLQSRLVQAEASRSSTYSEAERLFEKMNLRGWLCKRGVKGGPIGRRWQRRWFSMDARGHLYYYKSNNNTVPRGYISLDFILAVEDVFPTIQDKNNASFNVITEGRTYELMAHDQEEKEKWINALDFIRSWRSQMASINL